jgi:hypothetical protein
MPTGRICAVVGHRERERCFTALSVAINHLRSLLVSQVDAILRLNAAFIQKYGVGNVHYRNGAAYLLEGRPLLGVLGVHNLMSLDISRAVLLF